jgi:alpha-tubulin suppressor-like RCC1 family protein
MPRSEPSDSAADVDLMKELNHFEYRTSDLRNEVNGTLRSIFSPLPSARLAGVRQVAAGRNHSLALKNDGSFVSWGTGVFGLSNVPRDLAAPVAVAAGSEFAVALERQGTVKAWGSINVPAGLGSVTSIAAGGSHVLALLADGTMRGWGTLVPPEGLAGVRSIVAGGMHDLALMNDGSIRAWGSNSYGQCNIPVNLGSVIGIAAGRDFSIAIRADRTMEAWGDNSAGQRCTSSSTAPSVKRARKRFGSVSANSRSSGFSRET